MPIEQAAARGGGVSHSSFVPKEQSAARDSGTGRVEEAALQARLRAERILIVDDSQSHCELLTRTLGKLGNGFVATAEDGQVAVEAVLAARVERLPFGIVIMDFMMPRCGGAEAVRRIRQHGIAVPILGLTGNATAETTSQR